MNKAITIVMFILFLLVTLIQYQSKYFFNYLILKLPQELEKTLILSIDNQEIKASINKAKSDELTTAIIEKNYSNYRFNSKVENNCYYVDLEINLFHGEHKFCLVENERIYQ